MRDSSKDKTRLLHILEAIDNINEFKQGILYDETIYCCYVK